jgi:hypothetical protein
MTIDIQYIINNERNSQTGIALKDFYQSFFVIPQQQPVRRLTDVDYLRVTELV